MPYTSWGYMTHEDIREVEEDMDLGSIDIQMDDPPEWFERSYPRIAGREDRCPVCGQSFWTHESVTVVRASGEIFRCVDAEGETHELTETEDGGMYA